VFQSCTLTQWQPFTGGGGIPTELLRFQRKDKAINVTEPLLNALRIDAHPARGFAVGVAAHGIGTARAFQVSEQMGAFAGLAMGLTALVTAFIAPWLAPALVTMLTR